MQIHSIPKPPLQKAQDMELSNLYNEEFKIFAMEYNTPTQEPHNELDHFVNKLQQTLLFVYLLILGRMGEADRRRAMQ
jgi:hypothetical protein